VNTRLDKLDAGQYDAIILATAGLQRLGFADRITSELPAPAWLPAPAQGAIGVQCRSDDDHARSLLASLNDAESESLTEAERALSRRLGGSCQLPLAAHARFESNGEIVLDALVGSSDGRSLLLGQGRASADVPREAAEMAAQALLSQGADAIIRAELELASRRQ
jgi:hydroxymethylbilane synthase